MYRLLRNLIVDNLPAVHSKDTCTRQNQCEGSWSMLSKEFCKLCWCQNFDEIDTVLKLLSWLQNHTHYPGTECLRIVPMFAGSQDCI